MTEPRINPASRRPLNTRSWPIFIGLAARLARAGVTPNAISIMGMAMGIAAGLLLAATGQVDGWKAAALWLAGACCIQLRLICNLLDGMVAERGQILNPIGELYNEVPDRVSDSATLIGAGFAFGGCPILGLLAALAAMFTAYVRAIGAHAGAGQCFAGPMAKPQRMALMTLLCLLMAFLPVGFQSPGGHGLPAWALGVVLAGSLLTGARRLLRIAASLRERKAAP